MVVSPLSAQFVLLLLSETPHGHAHQVIKVFVRVFVFVVGSSLHHCSVKVLFICLGLNRFFFRLYTFKALNSRDFRKFFEAFVSLRNPFKELLQGSIFMIGDSLTSAAKIERPRFAFLLYFLIFSILNSSAASRAFNSNYNMEVVFKICSF